MKSFTHGLGRYCLVSAFILWGTALAASAVTLNWNSVAWTGGNTAGYYNAANTYSATRVTGTGGSVLGIVMTGSTSSFVANGNPTNTPAISTHFTGDNSTTNKSLQMETNYSTTGGSSSSSITVTINFYNTAGVSNVSIPLYDVDYNAGQFTDQIRSISASDGTNTYALTVTGSADNSVASSGTLSASATGTAIAPDSGTGSSDGTVTLSYTGAAPITSITFTYGDNINSALGPVTPNPPQIQGIGIGNISYTVAPEPSTALTALLLVAFLGVRHWKFRPTDRFC